MLRIRLIEEAIAERYSEQKMRCPTHLSIGQEACAVGISAKLLPKDKVFSSHRAHAHYLAKGGNLNRLIAELYGKGSGCTGGRGGSMHLTDLDAGFVASTAIVANSIPVAAGQALHQQLRGETQLTVSYFGEGATEEGAFYETANFAVVKQLPLLLVCENNRYSVYSSLACRQPKNRSIKALAEAIGIYSLEGNGNDVREVAARASQAVSHIRAGNGPAFIELHTYRHREHCGPHFDDDLGYRPKEERESWFKRDPLQTVEDILSAIPHWKKAKASMIEKIEKEIGEAFDAAINAPFPDSDNNEVYVYAE
nr:thiamine pyrophosphate-dependent dehydrogenase E1 component subunit alpha [Aestuariibacter sp. A3R04]